ncbi:MAG: 16S rRNA (cytidine(1402)-2'-O)-methyltransferase [Defluviitaleaceae bacterium]|nr:16S rRNA (cytidine(1402)-2'-O)-methyltransferase [Defluviitaleaceae bacterium]
MLYICGTPIGNLEDITLRQLRILEEVDLIAAEDTRHSIKLLNHYNIKTKLISYHANSSEEKTAFLIEQLLQEKKIALISDSGMPLISDPGSDLVRLCYKNNIKITTVPGATALISGLILSGLSCSKFVFEGFLPIKKSNAILEKLKTEHRQIILYEAPHRLLKTLNLLNENMPNRKISIIRELTKVYEESLLFETISNSIAYFEFNKPKGEIVIVIEGKEEEAVFNISIKEHVELFIEEGLRKNEAIKKVAKIRGLAKSEVYKDTFDLNKL